MRRYFVTAFVISVCIAWSVWQNKQEEPIEMEHPFGLHVTIDRTGWCRDPIPKDSPLHCSLPSLWYPCEKPEPSEDDPGEKH